MPQDDMRKEHEAELQPAETVKKFVKPVLTRHESLPRVTNVVAGGGSP